MIFQRGNVFKKATRREIMQIKVDILTIGLRMCLKILTIFLNKWSKKTEKLISEMEKVIAHHKREQAKADKRMAEAKERLGVLCRKN